MGTKQDSAALIAIERLTEGIVDLDRECRTPLSDVEHGLANVKLEFSEQALRETGKSLNEESLITWRLQRKLTVAGYVVEWEHPYADFPRKKCDLVIQLGDSGRLWLEIKLAWKSWFNCEGEPTYLNGFYLSYLQGSKSRTHSFHHDFEKLEAAASLASEHRAVCLIGFDHVNDPMDVEVAAVADSRNRGDWDCALERHWFDRRCKDYRINVWNYLLQPKVE